MKKTPKVPKDTLKKAPWVPNWVPREARSPGDQFGKENKVRTKGKQEKNKGNTEQIGLKSPEK